MPYREPMLVRAAIGGRDRRSRWRLCAEQSERPRFVASWHDLDCHHALHRLDASGKRSIMGASSTRVVNWRSCFEKRAWMHFIVQREIPQTPIRDLMERNSLLLQFELDSR